MLLSGLLWGIICQTIPHGHVRQLADRAMGQIDNGMDDIELIKEKLNIVDLISEYLPLKKAGVNFKASCPFHQEKTPSFMVSPERQIWHCFGCGRGGDTFKFLMEKEGWEFKEALEVLAQKAGIVLKRTRRESDGRERLYLANQKAQQLFSYLLTDHILGKIAYDYLKKRGLQDTTIKTFGLGYAPQSWETLTKFLKKRGFLESELISSGLAVPSRDGCYDRFRGRIIFPLLDLQNRVLGFSGRVLGGGEPKYINTPQTAIFDKGRFLFGLNLAKGEIKKLEEAILVEGEMDMMLSFQSGVENVVASKGTALTESQIELLKRYALTLSLGFDIDPAGDAASRRGIELADQAGLNLKVVSIEGGKDPGDICLSKPAAWRKMVTAATPIYDYYLESAQRRFDLKKADCKKAVFAELLPIWKKITDPIVKEHYIQKLAALLQVSEELIRQELARIKPQIKRPTMREGPDQISQIKEADENLPDRRQLLEEYLIALILRIPADHTYIPSFPETLLTQEESRQIYVLLALFLDSISFAGRSFSISEFVKTLPEQLVSVVDRLYLIQLDEKLVDSHLWQREVDLVVAQLKKMLIKTSLEKLSLQIKNAQEFEKVEILETLNKRFRDLSIKLKNL